MIEIVNYFKSFQQQFSQKATLQGQEMCLSFFYGPVCYRKSGRSYSSAGLITRHEGSCSPLETPEGRDLNP